MIFNFDIATLLTQWESVGIFDYLLPFLLIFALVFGILTATGILGGNRAVALIISLVVGLISLRFGFVTTFLSEVFPRLGVGLAVLLTILILVGLFIPEDERRFWGWGLGAIGFIIAIVVISKSFDFVGWVGYGGPNIDRFVGWLIGAVILIGVIIALATSGKGGGGRQDAAKYVPWWPHP